MIVLYYSPLGTRGAERFFGLGEQKIVRTFVRTAAKEHHLARTVTKNGQDFGLEARRGGMFAEKRKVRQNLRTLDVL